jgi:trans-aconitate 3-methyltransferase
LVRYEGLLVAGSTFGQARRNGSALDQVFPVLPYVLRALLVVHLYMQTKLYTDPSTKNAEAVQKVLSHLEDDILGPYELPANNLSRTMYRDLIMPWTVDPGTFPQSSFLRSEWNRDGKLEPGCDDFFGGSSMTTLKELAESLGTASMVTRWREHHHGLVGTDEDCVAKTMKDVADALGQEWPFDLGGTTIRVGSSTTLLLFTRNSLPE